MIMGCVLIAAVLVSYSMKQGYDARHLYLLGIATAGVAIMFIVATIAFAILLGPSKSAEAKPKTTKASTQITLCVLQAFGTAALIWLFVLPLSAVLVAALNAA